MMKKLTALLLALVMLLSVSTAFAWSCPSCGSDNGGKFCTECGTKKPEDVICPSCGTNYGDAAPKFCTECGQKLGETTATAAPAATAAPTAEPTAAPAEALDVVMYQHDDGRLFLLWDADGTTEYVVHYFPMLTNDPKADVADASNTCFGKFAVDEVGVYPCSYMVPGMAYWVGVFDSEGNGEYMPYVPQEEVASFADFPVNVQTTEVLRQDGEDTQVEAFVAADLAACAEDTHGLYLVLLYNNAGAAAEHVLQVVMELPDGQRYVSRVVKATFQEATDDGIGWRFYDLVDDVEKINLALGEVPMGEYKVSIYLNGQLAGTAPFQVVEKAASTALEINGFAPMGDGSVELAWTGGTAPYTVVYALRTGEDVDMDLDAASDVGFLHVEDSELQATSTVMYELIPGEKYWLVVLDAQGNRAYSAIKTQTSAFTDFETELVVSSNPVDAGKSNVAANYWDGLHVGFVYNNPGEAREVYLQCVIDYGSGLKKVTENGKLVMQSGRNCLDLGSFDSLDAFMEAAAKDVGFKPENDVTLSMYVDGKLAGRAVLPAKAEAPTFEITGVQNQPDGTHLLTWEDNGNGPWDVNFVEHWSDDFAADKEDERSSTYWSDAVDVAETSYLLQYLVPGRSYWIKVTDSKGNADLFIYDVPVSGSGAEFSTEVCPRLSKDGVYTDIEAFSAAAVNEGNMGDCGLYLVLGYDPVAANTSKHTKFVLKLPNGVRFCAAVGKVNVYTTGQTYFEFLDLDWAFAEVKDWCGEVPLGEYSLDVYMEGRFVASVAFEVTEDGASTKSDDDAYGVEIVSIVENSDGTATVTWTDANNNGPYDIRHVQKRTEDYHADRAAGTGALYGASPAEQGSCLVEYLVPGQAYWICVYDKDGYGSFVPYEPAAAQAFPEFTMKLELEPVLRIGTDMKVSEFSSAEIGAGLSEHGLELWIGHPQLARTRNYLGIVSITSPDGAKVVVSMSEWQLDQGEAKSVGWRFFDLAWYFNIMTDSFGAVPVGTYTVEFFCDGELACSNSFHVTD